MATGRAGHSARAWIGRAIASRDRAAQR